MAAPSHGRDGPLVRAFLDGDRHAGLALYGTVRELAHGEWRRMRGRLGTVVDSDDIAHETWICLERAFDGYDQARDLRHFLSGVVRNTARQMAKRERRQSVQELARASMAHGDGEAPSDAILSLDKMLASTPGLLVNFVRSVMLPRLQARQRPVAVLYYIARTSPLLIAEALHRSPRSVYEALIRIEQRLCEDALSFFRGRIPDEALALLRELLHGHQQAVGERAAWLRRVCAAALEKELGRVPASTGSS